MNIFRIREFLFSIGVILVFQAGIFKAEDIHLENKCQPYIEKALNDLKKENVDISTESETTVDFEETKTYDSSVDAEDFSKENQIIIELNKENFTSSETSQQNLTDENEENKSNTDEAPNNMENEGSQEKIEESDAEKMSMMIDENETLNVDSIEDTSITNEKATSTEEEGNSILRINRDISETTNEHNLEILFEKESEENEGSGNSDLLEENAQVSIQTGTSSQTDSESSFNENLSVIESDEKGESTEDKQNEEFSTDENLNTNAEFSTDEFEKTNNIEEHNSSVQNDLPQENTNNDISIENNGKDDEIYKSKEVEQDVSEDPTAFNEDINIVEEEDSNGEKNVEPDKTDFETKEKPYEAQNNVDGHPEEDLLMEFIVPENLRDRSHINELLHLNQESSKSETAIDKAADIILRDLKRIYDNAIKPLETLYKYRDLSNRHFGDPEIFSKPLVLFMGPWSGGKSSILNYLSDNEYTSHSIRSGAEPSPAYFNILMYGQTPEVLDGTQLAADWTFSGLQKFGQGMLDRLRGLKLPSKLLKKVNIVEIPGILEVRKQVSRFFPFNDACQWFIDRADIIFLVYDPSKLDVGPETEAILDQLKGREYQTKILLNKADTVKPEELLRVQSALIWNISPLMSSAHPPVLYTVSLWSNPYKEGAPIRLLQAQERALLKDLQEAIEKRIENKIASARRFAVRIRNHAKMVDCYLTTYYNHKTLFANKKQVSDHIIENPSQYHIYEGLSTLTNISRYDLPNEEAYRDFFKLNPLYNFNRLTETCTYFKGCPINKLDIAISYQLPELVTKYKKVLEQELTKIDKENTGEILSAK